MSYGRSGDRPLDDPVYDELFAAAASLRRPVFLHPQIPSNAVRDASYRGFDPTTELALATFGWGWHIEAGTAALRLILRGTFDYPFHRLDAATIADFLGTLPDREDQEKIAHTNAEVLYGLGQPASAADDLAAAQLQGQS